MSDIDDPGRLEALARSGLLRHNDHDRLVRICYTATELLDVDAAQINVVTESKQIHIAEWPRAVRPPMQLIDSGCAQVVLADQLVAIEDTLKHPVMCRMPWTASWRGYIGIPLRFDGQTLGTLCALSVRQRAWTTMDHLTLQGLADIAEGAIRLDMP